MSLEFLLNPDSKEAKAFLGQKADVGGDEVWVSSNICQWKLRARFKVANIAIPDGTVDDLGLAYDFRRETFSKTGSDYYCLTSDDAKKLHGVAKEEFGQNRIAWRLTSTPFMLTMTADLSTMVGWSSDRKPQDVFENGLMREVQYYSWFRTGAMSYHGSNLIFVPSLLQEIGLAYGMISDRIYDYREVASIPDTAAALAQCEELFGTPPVGVDETVNDMKPIEHRSEHGALYRARKEIWKALGADTSHSNYWTARTHSDTNKGVVPGTPLHQLLGFVSVTQYPGEGGAIMAATHEIPAELSTVINPIAKMGDEWLRSVERDPVRQPLPFKFKVDDNGEHVLDENGTEILEPDNEWGEKGWNRFPVVLRVWRDISEAGFTSDEDTSEYPPLPKEWDSQGVTKNEWVMVANEYITKNGGKLTGPLITKMSKDAEMAVTKEEIEAWKPYLVTEG
jgi:hypothetical protein